MKSALEGANKLNDIVLQDIQQKKISNPRESNHLKKILLYMWKEKLLYLMVLPGISLLFIFSYVPMYGIIIAFKDYNLSKGILGSDWVGLKYFISFFKYPECWEIIRNTVILGLSSLVFVFPIPIVFAILLNEMGGKIYKKFIQTVSYMPHFLSTVIIAGMAVNFLSPSNGIVNVLLGKLTGSESIFFLMQPEWFRPIYIFMCIWQGTGWGAIIYFAALTSIDIEQYEAATIDGAGRLKKIWHVSLPGILPTIVIMFLLSVGQLLNVSFETIILLYNPMTYETADVISTYVYRRGIISFDYSFSTAVGLFQSVIGLVLTIVSNKLARKYTETGLW